jgi:hypothetical protein
LRELRESRKTKLELVPKNEIDSRKPTTGSLRSILRFVVARFAAGRAVIEAVVAQANIYLPLAQAAVLFAFTLLLSHLALHASEL